ncbi:uncharacterized protein [Phaenicophaeus curvirostris]|uniref:uncharacterized protein n=1 Tax=Phaenicophaeus curvirostris TaxID=33595 RepID=UPI0037F0FF63
MGCTKCCRAVAAERYCSPGRGERDGPQGRASRAARGGERRAGRGAGRFAERLGSARLLSAPRGAVRDGSARLCSSLPFRPPPLRPTGCGLGQGDGQRPQGPRAPPGRERLERGRVGRDNLTEVLAMREPLRDPDPSSGREGEVTWWCPPGQQLSERCGAFPSLSYARGGRRGGCPRVKRKRLPFSPRSQSGECPCCRKPGKSLTELPCFCKARYSSTFHPVVRSNERAEDGLQGRENQSEASGQLDSKWGETLMPALLDLSFSLMTEHKTWLYVTGRLLGKWQEEDRQETVEHAL